MHGAAQPAISGVLFGLSPLLVSLTVFVATYVVIVTERINRAIVALLGAGVMIMSGVLHQSEAFAGIDFNTIGLLTGMMVIVAMAAATRNMTTLVMAPASQPPFWLIACPTFRAWE